MAYLVETDKRYIERVNCNNRRKGCDWKGLNGKLRPHLEQCSYENVKCKFCKAVLERRHINNHQNLNPTEERLLEGCNNAEIQCTFCKRKYERQELNAHMNVNPSWEDRERGCQCTPIECKFCKKTVKRKELKEHLNLDSKNAEQQLQGCDLVQISCVFCNEIMQRKDMRVHINLRPTEANWHEGCDKAIVYCMFCKQKYSRAQLEKHINIHPTPQNWLDGCDVAELNCIYCNEKLKRWQLKVKAKKVENELDEKSCRVVVATSYIAKEKWYEIGLELNVDRDVLNQIKLKHKGKDAVDKYFYEMIQEWLKSEQKKSWKTLITALRSSRVELIHVAKIVERSVICEDAMLKTINDHIVAIENDINRINQLLKKAKELREQYTEKKTLLEKHKKELVEIRIEMEELKKQGNDQAAPKVKEKMKKSKSKVGESEEGLLKVTEENYSVRKADIQKNVNAIEDCVRQLNDGKETMTIMKQEFKQQSLDLKQEHQIKLHRAADKITVAKKWGVGGVAAMCGGAITAALSPFTGPAAPFVFGIGITLASVGAGTAATATGVGFYFKLERDKFSEEQKRIDTEYIPLTQACEKTLDKAREALEAANIELNDLQEVLDDYKSVLESLHD